MIIGHSWCNKMQGSNSEEDIIIQALLLLSKNSKYVEKYKDKLITIIK